MKKLSKELVGASAIPILLSILSKKESYGYEIIQQVKTISNSELAWGEGSLYPVLHKLEKKGLIDSVWKIAENGRKRKYYRLNQTGKKELKMVKANWEFMNQIIMQLWKTAPRLT